MLPSPHPLSPSLSNGAQTIGNQSAQGRLFFLISNISFFWKSVLQWSMSVCVSRWVSVTNGACAHNTDGDCWCTVRAGKDLCNTVRDLGRYLRIWRGLRLDSAADIEFQHDQMINKLVLLEISQGREFSNDCKLVNDFKKHVSCCKQVFAGFS